MHAEFSGAEWHVKKVSFCRVVDGEAILPFHVLHEPAFCCIDPTQNRFMEDGLLPFLVHINFQHLLHQLVASEDGKDAIFYF